MAGAGGNGACFDHDIDLRTVKVSGSLKINGAIASMKGQGDGTIFLVGGGGRAHLGSTSATTGMYSSSVLPGTYDLYYSVGAPGTATPYNTNVRLRSGIVVATSPVILDVDIPSTKVSGTITFNGAAIKDFGDDGQGQISLVDAQGGKAVLAYLAPSRTYSVMVVPGTYDLYYKSSPAGTVIPTNTAVKLKSGIVVGTTPLSLDVDLPIATVSATATINGAAIPAFPAFPNVLWSLSLENADGVAPLPTFTAATKASPSGSYSGHVLAGTYDLYWSAVNSVDIPGNSHVKIKSGIVVGSGSLSISADIPSTTLSGKATVAGTAYDDLSYLVLKGTAGDSVPIRVGATGAIAAHVAPGTYDLYYSSTSASLRETPTNISAKLQSGIVIGTAPATLNVDVPSTKVTGTVTLNGAAITSAATSAFVLTLKNAAGDRAQLANRPGGGKFSVYVVPGTYDLYYAQQGDIGLTVPNNNESKIRTGIVIGTGSPFSLDVDLHGAMVSGVITVNGTPSKATAFDLAFLTLSRDTNNEALITTVPQTTSPYTTFVLSGTYRLSYLLYNSTGASLPTNTQGDFGCFVVP